MKIDLPLVGQGKTVLLEAGHIYTNQVPGGEHHLGASYANCISQALQSHGADVVNLLFIDDYNPNFSDKPIVLDLDSYRALLAQAGFPVNVTKYEAEFVNTAREFLSQLRKKGATYEDESTVVLSDGNVWLYDHDNQKYSCALLDAVLSYQKSQVADAAVTIVPKSFKKQQRDVKKILAALDIKTESLFVAYLNEESPVAVYPHQVNSHGELAFVEQSISLASILYPFTKREVSPLEQAVSHA